MNTKSWKWHFYEVSWNFLGKLIHRSMQYIVIYIHAFPIWDPATSSMQSLATNWKDAQNMSEQHHGCQNIHVTHSGEISQALPGSQSCLLQTQLQQTWLCCFQAQSRKSNWEEIRKDWYLLGQGEMREKAQKQTKNKNLEFKAILLKQSLLYPS